jgi:hypothetical protein
LKWELEGVGQMRRLKSLFNVSRTPDTDILNVSLKACSEQPWGWEWGTEDGAAQRVPLLRIRVGKLVVFGFEAWYHRDSGPGFELWFMGFWWIWALRNWWEQSHDAK